MSQPQALPVKHESFHYTGRFDMPALSAMLTDHFGPPGTSWGLHTSSHSSCLIAHGAGDSLVCMGDTVHIKRTSILVDKGIN